MSPSRCVLVRTNHSDPANQRSNAATGIKALTTGVDSISRIQRFALRHQARAGPRVEPHTTEEEKAPKMKKIGLATLVAGGLTAATLGLAAPAVAAPTGPGNAQDTINDLKADGYNVIVNRVGGTPLEQATVVAVRPGQTYSRTDSGNPGDSLATTVTSKTVYVDVK
jgi:hypothetical protein